MFSFSNKRGPGVDNENAKGLWDVFMICSAFTNTISFENSNGIRIQENLC